MRTTTMLIDGFEDITTLVRYLYLSAEHTITVNNGMADLQIRMDDDGDFLCKVLSFPDANEMLYSCNISSPVLVDYIRQLKTQPASKVWEKEFDSRWEEIETITMHNVAHNKLYKY